jgi:hypothetical protein
MNKTSLPARLKSITVPTYRAALVDVLNRRRQRGLSLTTMIFLQPAFPMFCKTFVGVPSYLYPDSYTTYKCCRWDQRQGSPSHCRSYDCFDFPRALAALCEMDGFWFSTAYIDPKLTNEVADFACLARHAYVHDHLRCGPYLQILSDRVRDLFTGTWERFGADLARTIEDELFKRTRLSAAHRELLYGTSRPPKFDPSDLPFDVRLQVYPRSKTDER